MTERRLRPGSERRKRRAAASGRGAGVAGPWNAAPPEAARPSQERRVRAVLPFEAVEPMDKADSEPTFVVDVDGFEGPLDLLLELARRQKVDLAKISVLKLAEQYLAFVEEARRVRLELAADYLVMAAWLAYLKSRLLLPEQAKPDEPAAADLAQALAERLQRLELIRVAAEKLVNRPRLGRDLFLRGMPESPETTTRDVWKASLFDLLSAYARQRQRQAMSRVTLKKREVWSLAEARAALERLAGIAREWTHLDAFLLEYCVDPAQRRTARASSFVASLEMVREGLIDIRQDETFAPLWVRARPRLALAATEDA
jgi:segregation and condensation protein A